MLKIGINEIFSCPRKLRNGTHLSHKGPNGTLEYQETNSVTVLNIYFLQEGNRMILEREIRKCRNETKGTEDVNVKRKTEALIIA